MFARKVYVILAFTLAMMLLPVCGTASAQEVYKTKPEGAKYDYYYVLNEDGSATVTQGYNDDSITIPSSLDGHPVTGIGDCAFFMCTSISKLVIPDSVTSIGESAFCACISLADVTISSNVTSIGPSAFEACSADLTIACSESSYVQTYAQANGINFNNIILTSNSEMADIKEVIVGKWFCINDSSTLEILVDGNMKVSSWRGMIDYGTYEIDDSIMSLQTPYSHHLTEYQNSFFTIKDVSTEKITLAPIGGNAPFVFIRYVIMNQKIIGKWVVGKEGSFFGDDVQNGTIEFKDDYTVAYQSADNMISGSGTFCFIDENNIAIIYSRETYGVAQNYFITYTIDQIDDEKLVWEWSWGMKEELARGEL